MLTQYLLIPYTSHSGFTGRIKMWQSIYKKENLGYYQIN